MSRIGNFPIEIPEKVEVTLDENTITVKGPRGELKQQIDPGVSVKKEDDNVIVERHTDDKDGRSVHGLTRSLIDNMVKGVVDGYEKKLEMVGVGYSAQVKGGDLTLEVGYSHPFTIEAVENIKFEVNDNNIIIVKGIDKQEVGDMAAKIRAVRKPEPYKGKGIKYVDEHIRRKVGKTG